MDISRIDREGVPYVCVARGHLDKDEALAKAQTFWEDAGFPARLSARHEFAIGMQAVHLTWKLNVPEGSKRAEPVTVVYFDDTTMPPLPPSQGG